VDTPISGGPRGAGHRPAWLERLVVVPTKVVDTGEPPVTVRG
jgi:hypothetical protein